MSNSVQVRFLACSAGGARDPLHRRSGKKLHSDSWGNLPATYSHASQAACVVRCIAGGGEKLRDAVADADAIPPLVALCKSPSAVASEQAAIALW